MKVHKPYLTAVRLIRQGFESGPAIRAQLKFRGIRIRPVPFYFMMAKLEARHIVCGFNESINGCSIRHYQPW